MAVLWVKVAQQEVALDELTGLLVEVVQGLLHKDPIARLTAQDVRFGPVRWRFKGVSEPRLVRSAAVGLHGGLAAAGGHWSTKESC